MSKDYQQYPNHLRKSKFTATLRKLLLFFVTVGILIGSGIAIFDIASILSKKANRPTFESEERPSSGTEQVQDSGEWNLILVNPWNILPDDFSVELEELETGHKVDARIAPVLRKMFRDARTEGLDPVICSSYRTQGKQERLFSAKVDRYIAEGYSEEKAREKAAKWVAVPGTSEHQTGLALDIVARSNPKLNKSQQDTAEQQWLMDNSYKYGFILRYPDDKTELTGISFEPWHYRYVGKEAAKEIHDSGICLEEYLDAER